MPSPPDVGVVLVAAGRGERAGGGVPKQFRLVAGVPVLARVLRRFLAHRAVAIVVVVLPADVVQAPPEWLRAMVGPRVRLVAGGAARIDSVERGVESLGGQQPVVLVHDAARPLVDAATIDAVITAARSGTGAVAALPVADTLKKVGAGGRIEATLDRSTIWRAQTPQGFPAALLANALRHARATGATATDDSAAVEAIGGPVIVIPDRPSNLKITEAEDVALASALVRANQ
ncbi:MAG: 2-C-methyl-D-erythritol 4-phosphate cytidylyltransferase [Gemmatimonadetes bacterium]|nr:2-C-methyl-D-erythritol 4-phosphate cytidylyltransferase [Gemmatimonadota bacterium]